jgi:hypothetical protein
MRTLTGLVTSVVLTIMVFAPSAHADVTPKDGTYKGAPVCEGYCGKTVVKVKNGKIVKFTVGPNAQQTIEPEGGIKIKPNGKFNYRADACCYGEYILKGKFTSNTKVKGTYEVTGADSVVTFSKHEFTAKFKTAQRAGSMGRTPAAL